MGGAVPGATGWSVCLGVVMLLRALRGSWRGEALQGTEQDDMKTEAILKADLILLNELNIG